MTEIQEVNDLSNYIKKSDFYFYRFVEFYRYQRSSGHCRRTVGTISC